MKVNSQIYHDGAEKRAMKGENMLIPIVMAANEKYIPYLGVALHSLIQHTAREHEYRVHVLNESISDANKRRISAMQTSNVSITFIDVSSYFEELNIPAVNHLSEEVAFRLLADRLFPQYEKLLYLDCDLIVNQDVAELYQTDLQDCILGASRAALVKGLYNYLETDLCFPYQNYFNSGVLLINTPLFSRYGIGERSLAMLRERRYLTQDQDVLNLLCKDRVMYFDGRWNVEWEYLTPPCGGEMVIDEGRKDILSYTDDPYIVHYTSPWKPWAHPETELADYFWENARETIFYEQILFQNRKATEKAADPFARFLFPWRLITPDSRIVLYGGGEVGKAFLSQNEKAGYCQVCAVCDRNPAGTGALSAPVIGIDKLSQYTYDSILIAIEKESIAGEIKETLMAQGISETKIRWAQPNREQA